MAKRAREEGGAIVETSETTVKKQKTKKDKKEKKTKLGEDEHKVPSNGTAYDTGNGNALSKEERKALKRAKNEAAAAAVRGNAENATGAVDEDMVLKAEKEARKKIRKAEKKKDNTPPSATDTLSAPASNRSQVRSADEKATEAYYAENHIAVVDPLKQSIGPVLSFNDLQFDKKTCQAYFSGFSSPTPVQAASWPYLFNGRDMISVAETGSGKTFAFGVPCINRLESGDKRIRVCIVSPTRELALQIQEQMSKLAGPCGLKATCVFGGVPKEEQRKLLHGTHILVATPGRLNDFVSDGGIDLSKVEYLVLDEADRMLDTGFEHAVRQIIAAAAPSKDRQTLMFTATWPESVRKLASEFLRDPVRITIGENATGELRANTRIVQQVEVIEEMEKQNRLFQLLKQYQSGKNKKDRILVFALYKKEATRLEEFIRRKGFSVAGIHGDLSQQKRMESLEAFKKGEIPLLVATDVAARGLDIPAVKVVINVTFPLTVEDYVHRIGRTGRAGQDGRAITLFTQNEKGLAGALINVLKKADQPVPEELMKFGTTVKKKGHDAYGAFYKDTSDAKVATKITFD